MAHFETLFQRPDKIHRPLFVLTSVFNSVRYRNRWKLYQDFARRCEDVGAILYTTEIAFGERDFAVTEPDNPRHLQLRTSTEMWLKERALNLLAMRLPADAKYIAWIDADVRFARDDWADETVHRLQHYSVVQMFSQSIHLSHENEIMGTSGSFAWCHQNGLPIQITGTAGGGYPYYEPGMKSVPKLYPHPGYAWAMRREAWEALGGLIDWCILGGADWHMAHALLDNVEFTLKDHYTPRFAAMMKEWEARAHRSIRQNLGTVPGTIFHYWHGPKGKRRYNSRTAILKKCEYDPELDLKKDMQGLYQLTGRSIELRDQIRKYLAERDEDALS